MVYSAVARSEQQFSSLLASSRENAFFLVGGASSIFGARGVIKKYDSGREKEPVIPDFTGVLLWDDHGCWPAF